MPVQSWTGCAGSTAASWRAGTPRSTSPLTESFHGTVAYCRGRGRRCGCEILRLSRGLDRPIAVPQARSVSSGFGDLRGRGVRARPCPTIPKRGIRDCADWHCV